MHVWGYLYYIKNILTSDPFLKATSTFEKKSWFLEVLHACLIHLLCLKAKPGETKSTSCIDQNNDPNSHVNNKHIIFKKAIITDSGQNGSFSPVFLSFCLFVIFVFLYFCIFCCLFVFLSFCLFVFLSFCLFVFLSFCLFSFFLFVFLPFCRLAVPKVCSWRVTGSAESAGQYFPSQQTSSPSL